MILAGILSLTLFITPITSDTDVFSLCLDSSPSINQPLATGLENILVDNVDIGSTRIRHLQIRPRVGDVLGHDNFLSTCPYHDGEVWIQVDSHGHDVKKCLAGRISWPASFPSDLSVKIPDESSGSLYAGSIHIRAFDRGEVVPLGRTGANSVTDGATKDIPFIIVLESLAFGIVPSSIIWTVGLIFVFTGAATYGVPSLLNHLENVVDRHTS